MHINLLNFFIFIILMSGSIFLRILSALISAKLSVTHTLVCPSVCLCFRPKARSTFQRLLPHCRTPGHLRPISGGSSKGLCRRLYWLVNAKHPIVSLLFKIIRISNQKGETQYFDIRFTLTFILLYL